MAIIDSFRSVYTVVITFQSEDEKEQDIILTKALQFSSLAKKYNGFISSNFHKSHDGKNILNYAQWKSQQDYEAFRGDSSIEQERETIMALSVSAQTYYVVETF